MSDPRLPPASVMDEPFAVKWREWPFAPLRCSPSTTASPSRPNASPAGLPLRRVKLCAITSRSFAPFSALTSAPTRAAKYSLQNSIDPSDPVTMMPAGMAFMTPSL